MTAGALAYARLGLGRKWRDAGRSAAELTAEDGVMEEEDDEMGEWAVELVASEVDDVDAAEKTERSRSSASSALPLSCRRC